GGAPETVVVKLASDDPTSRATGVGMGAYYREIAFYRHLAGRIGGPLPACHHAEYDPAEGWFSLVLEDVAGATQGDQIEGCTVEQAEIALRELARVHAPVLGDLALGTADYLNQPNPLNQQLLEMLLPGFLERYADRMAPEHAEVCTRFVPVLDAWAAEQRPPLGLVHGDYRLDNLLFGDGTCTVVDWQTVTWGPVMLDAAYFIGGGLSVEDRRASERDLLRVYHDELRAQGVRSLPWEEVWDGYRRACFHGILMTVAASMVVVRTERGDDMFMTWLERNAQQVLDLDALDLLPEPDAGTPEPLRPEPRDEGSHEPGPEPLWNESWYFDAISDATDLGVYTRLGRLPNRDECLYTACICGPGRPSMMLAGTFPLPAADDEAQVVDVPGTVHAEHHCVEPLRRFHVTVEGTAQAHADESAPLRGETGDPIDIAFDLVWETDGEPYAWRQSTRYEIPCRVTGTVRVGDEEIAFAGPGQRDHSWGARDWWAVDWMWNGLHLEDGTHVHQVGVPQMPGYGVGYVQRDGDITEVTQIEVTTEVAENGLPSSAEIVAGPMDLTLDIEPVAFGALRLEAPDGRVSFFPRAMARCTARDGRAGVGWIEWNRVQREEA
ncbi:phosphotransferase, partial [Paraconexibacter sp.]|uniref:DUF7064 domain-containing protein n=1 Tax=Paraconexibacter sp. TaxID=2949640 RepID=UPI003561374D